MFCTDHLMMRSKSFFAIYIIRLDKQMIIVSIIIIKLIFMNNDGNIAWELFHYAPLTIHYYRYNHLNAYSSHKQANDNVPLIWLIFCQGRSACLRKRILREKEVKVKSREEHRRRERKRPRCFDDFSCYGNVPRLRVRFVASRASGPISRAIRYIESHRETTSFT